MFKQRWPALMLSPAFVLLVIVFLGPFLYMGWLSLTDLSFAIAERDGRFLGLDNFHRAIAGDQMFLSSLGRSALFALLCVVPQVVMGLAVSEFLFHHPTVRRVLSPVLSLPVLLPSVVVGLYWRLMLQGEFGVLSYYGSVLGWAGAKGILSNPDTILFTLAIVDFWHWGPFVALVLLVARAAVPRAPIEAAQVDGASRWRAFVDVTLPALLPTIFTIAALRAIDSFKEFDKVFILTGGGPGTASELSSVYTWRQAFRYWEFGYAAALCVLVYLLIYSLSRGAFGRVKTRVIG